MNTYGWIEYFNITKRARRLRELAEIARKYIRKGINAEIVSIDCILLENYQL